MGFSPNDLVFGHKVRGPLAVMQDGVQQVEPPVNVIDYVNGFKHQLYETMKLARDKLKKLQIRMKRLYDQRAVRCQLVIALVIKFSLSCRW